LALGPRPKELLVQKKGNDRRNLISSGGPILLVAVLVGLSLLTWQYQREPAAVPLTYGELEQILNVDDPSVRFQKVRVSPVEVRGEIATSDTIASSVPDAIKPNETRSFQTRIGLASDKELLKKLQERAGSDFDREPEEAMPRVVSSIVSLAMLVMMVGLGFLMLRWMSGGNSPFSFGRSRHKLYEEKGSKVTFENVAGIDEAVAELREIVDFLKTPEKYQALGGRIPKGVLLVGPPGTGKTLLAKAIAGEAEVPFFSMSGSDFVEMFVGVGASRVRDLFGQAETRAPCIVFIDELDALGKTRGGGNMGGHDEREQTLNQLLVEMDGFESNRGVILMAATNRPETLDPALLRPGRFDRQVLVDRPDIQGREAILKVHARTVKLGKDIDLRHIASLTPGSSGADLANLINEAALLAARGNKEEVTTADLNEAIERKDIGLERRSRIMRADEKERTAYHEAGHALVACSLPTGDPVHKVTIIPRGFGALGYVLRRPEDDRFMHTRSELEVNIKVAMGGTLAEELIYGDIANGATSDLDNANRIARAMVTQFGMSRLGRIYIRENSENPFLAGSSWSSGGGCSEQTAREIDQEIKKIIDDAVNEVRDLLASRREALVALAKKLIEKETIDGAEVRAMIEAHYPGPKLVPGTTPITPAAPRPTPQIEGEESRRAE
jgi:cell division protease FtsH